MIYYYLVYFSDDKHHDDDDPVFRVKEKQIDVRQATGLTQPHVTTRQEKNNKNLMVCYYKIKLKQKIFISGMEMLWRKKLPTATLDI